MATDVSPATAGDTTAHRQSSGCLSRTRLAIFGKLRIVPAVEQIRSGV
jgi:hypothetical protein